MDPHAVLGLEPGASPDEVRRAYRALAKRFHPDRAGVSAGDLMISINAAYDLLRDGMDDEPARQGGSRASPPLAGDWLHPAVRRVLARELLAALEPEEAVDEVVLTATGDSHDVQLVVTDRRLLWLRDDAIVGRVRQLRHRDVRSVEARPPGRLRRAGELRIQARDGRRVRFLGLAPERLRRLVALVGARRTG